MIDTYIYLGTMVNTKMEIKRLIEIARRLIEIARSAFIKMKNCSATADNRFPYAHEWSSAIYGH